MNEESRNINFYDYLKVVVPEARMSQALDGYECFGWHLDENRAPEQAKGKATLYFKRDRRILNKQELTRLQRYYEACMEEIDILEASRRTVPNLVSWELGLIGCVFMVGAVFAATAEPPIIWLETALGIPGFVCWIAALWGRKAVSRTRTKKVLPLIDKKYEEACEVCAQAEKLL